MHLLILQETCIYYQHVLLIVAPKHTAQENAYSWDLNKKGVVALCGINWEGMMGSTIFDNSPH